MDGLESLGPPAELPPLLAAGLEPVVSSNALWVRHRARDQREGAGAARARVAHRVPRPDRRAHRGGAHAIRCRSPSARCSTSPATCATCARSGARKREARIENLMELVSAAREYEARDPEPSLGGFVDQLSLLSEADEEDGLAQRARLADDDARGEGPGVPGGLHAGLEEGLFPHSRARDDEEELEEERRLCYVGMTRARERLVLTSAARRRVFGDYQSTAPSRFLDEVPQELIELATGFSSSYQRQLRQLRVPAESVSARRAARRSAKKPRAVLVRGRRSVRVRRRGARRTRAPRAVRRGHGDQRRAARRRCEDRRPVSRSARRR